MKRKAHLIAVVGLFATFGLLGGSIEVVDTAEASSYGHKSSMSLAGRSFKIRGTYVSWNPLFGPKPDDFDNCYTFVDDDAKTWLDPLFPDPTNPANAIPGTWVQHTGGFFTRYTAFAKNPPFFFDFNTGEASVAVVLLMQNGIVTRTFRRGKLRLNAYSTVVFGDGSVIGVVLSTGYSVESCQ